MRVDAPQPKRLAPPHAIQISALFDPRKPPLPRLELHKAHAHDNRRLVRWLAMILQRSIPPLITIGIAHPSTGHWLFSMGFTGAMPFTASPGPQRVLKYPSRCRRIGVQITSTCSRACRMGRPSQVTISAPNSIPARAALRTQHSTKLCSLRGGKLRSKDGNQDENRRGDSRATLGKGATRRPLL